MTTAAVPQIDWSEAEGGEGAVEAGKGGGGFSRTEFLRMEDGDTLFMRFVTDSPVWVYADQHASVPTKNPPEGYTGTSWPKAMPATCRHWKAFKGFFKDCYVCDSKMKDQWGKEMKPKSRVWAIACIREEVLGDGSADLGGEAMKGKRVGFRDATREVEEKDEKGDPTGKKIIERRMVVVNESSFLFFDQLQACYTTYGTVCDRDYIVTKKGKGKDGKFNILPMDPVAGCNPSNPEWWAKYPEAVEAQKIDVKAMILDRATDEFYARFIDPNKTPSTPESPALQGGQAQREASAEQQQVNSAPEPDQAMLDTMKNRVRSHVPGAADAASAAPDTPTPNTAAPAAAAPAGGLRDLG